MPERKRIVLVANTTWNIFNFRLNVIQKLVDEGHEVYVLAPVDEYIAYKENFPGVVHIGLSHLDRDSTNPLKDLFLVGELYRKYKKIKPSLIIHYTHKPNIFGSIAAMFAKIKSINVITGLGYSFIHKGWINTAMKALYRMVSSKAVLTVFENQDDLKLFIEEGLVDEGRAVSIKGCGVDASYYLPQPNGIFHETTTFTFIGRLLKDKGVREFAEAAKVIKARYPKTHFVMLGDFDQENPSTIERDQLLDWLNNDVVEYRGFVRDVRPYVSKSDCIILPSYREGLPRIILEGMAMAKPIITCDTAGCRETVDSGINGFLVQPRNVAALVSGIEQFMDLSAEEQKEMGRKGRAMVEELFDSKIIAAELYEHIKKHL
ncbi:MAG: glycosyltransferase family 4 protein [Saprospiraceae bacterium]|nr:glycosyltransferase family 4 protein [Saprospiraceae bacterium]